jgi:hypothetical protein
MKRLPLTGDWRDWRPAIWLAMLGVAVGLLVSPWYFGAVFIGAAIGVAIRIHQRRRRAIEGQQSADRRPKPPRPRA